jgi:hypothetical protein
MTVPNDDGSHRTRCGGASGRDEVAHLGRLRGRSRQRRPVAVSRFITVHPLYT